MSSSLPSVPCFFPSFFPSPPCSLLPAISLLTRQAVRLHHNQHLLHIPAAHWLPHRWLNLSAQEFTTSLKHGEWSSSPASDSYYLPSTLLSLEGRYWFRASCYILVSSWWAVALEKSGDREEIAEAEKEDRSWNDILSLLGDKFSDRPFSINKSTQKLSVWHF